MAIVRKPGHRAEMDAPVLSAATWLPSHCSRHGLPAVDLADFRIISRPPPPPGSWLARRSWLGALDILRELAWYTMNVQATPVSGWPVCAPCRRRHRVNRTLARGLFWAGLAALLAAIAGGLGVRVVTGDYAPAWVLMPMLGGPALMLLAAIPLSFSRMDKIARAETSVDGGRVWFNRPHPEFTNQMRGGFGAAWRDSSPTGRSTRSG